MAFLIDDILFLPIDGVVWLGEKVRKAALSELYDDSKVQEALLALEERFELGEITEDERQSEESLLLERMEEIRKYKEDKERGA